MCVSDYLERRDINKKRHFKLEKGSVAAALVIV